MKKHLKSRIALLLAAIAAAALVGCSGKNNSSVGEIRGAEQTVVGEEKETIGEKAMGRYVETLQEVSEQVGVVRGMTQMEDGSIVVLDTGAGKFVSKDQGKSWENESVPWLTELSQKAYIYDAVLSQEGYVALQYKDYEKTEEEAPAKEETLFQIDWNYILVKPDGTQINFGKNVKDIEYFFFSNAGELYASSSDQGIYHIDKETGEAKEILSITEKKCYLSIYDSVLTAINQDGIYLYDLDKQEKIEDKVLSDFYNSNLIGFESYSGNYYSAMVMQNEKDVIYILCREGLYRHVIGGSVMEQVIDGNLNSFSNPSLSFLGITSLEENSFLVLFAGGTVGKYDFDSNMPSVPELQLTAYSLLKNDSLQQAITLFQQKHPEVFVKYEVGMETDSSITREDAIKKLNAKMMAGTGPDIIMLDNLPTRSYLEKGMLADVTPYLSDLEKTEALLPNIRDTYKEKDKICAVPSKFVVPAIMGKQDSLAQIDSLSGLADTVEKIRSEQPEGSVLGCYLPMETLIKLSTAYAASWQSPDAGIDKEAVTEFLAQAKRIYEADIAGVSEAEMERQHKDQNERTNWQDSWSGEMYDRSASAGLSGFDIYAGDAAMEIGYLAGNAFGLAEIGSIIEVQENKDLIIKGMKLNHKTTYMPMYVMGIPASSDNQELAGEFLKVMIGKESQNLSYDGFSINREAFDKGFTNIYAPDSSERALGAVAGTDREGKEVMLDINWPFEPWIEQYRKIIEEAETPNLTDSILKEAVFEIGETVLTGEKTPEQATQEIVEKLAIYMAE